MNLTIAWITARALLGRKRVLLLLPFPVLVVGLTLIAHALRPDAADQWGPVIVDGLGLGVLLPVTAVRAAEDVHEVVSHIQRRATAKIGRAHV